MTNLSDDYMDYMDEVYFGLRHIAAGEPGELREEKDSAYDNDPDVVFHTAYTRILSAGTLVEDKELFSKAVYVGRELSKEFHEDKDTVGYQTLDYYLEKFIEMHRTAGITVD